MFRVLLGFGALPGILLLILKRVEARMSSHLHHHPPHNADDTRNHVLT